MTHTFEIAQLLAGHRSINIDQRDSDGKTPMDLAYELNRKDKARVLFEHGAQMGAISGDASRKRSLLIMLVENIFNPSPTGVSTQPLVSTKKLLEKPEQIAALFLAALVLSIHDASTARSPNFCENVKDIINDLKAIGNNDKTIRILRATLRHIQQWNWFGQDEDSLPSLTSEFLASLQEVLKQKKEANLSKLIETTLIAQPITNSGNSKLPPEVSANLGEQFKVADQSGAHDSTRDETTERLVELLCAIEYA